MIIQTGLRTDIPAFYSQWLLNRLKDGYVLVRNPFNEKSVSRYDLNPNVVDLITFCTKNPIPVIQNDELLEYLNKYSQLWYVSLTPYGKEIEPNVPRKAIVAEAIIHLGRILGSHKVIWRYDPIFISEKYTIDYHLKAFENIARRLSGYTKVVVISFMDLYPKVRRNFPEAQEVCKEDRLFLGKAFIEIADKYGMVLKACAEGQELAPFGADCSGCQTIEVLENVLNRKLKVPKMNPGRKNCNCFMNCDIGSYSSCGHFCRYCYANSNHKKVLENMKKHNPTSPLLIGELTEDDKISYKEQESWIIKAQPELF